uniref:Protein rolling stone n=1 Tax=Strongyloides venezuelensis TaxID=75913 RepID=A0A0K0FXI1_STRVS
MDKSSKNPLQDSFLNRSAKRYVHSIFGESVNFFWFFGQIHVKWIFVWAQLFLIFISVNLLLDCSAGNYTQCSPIWRNLFTVSDFLPTSDESLDRTVFEQNYYYLRAVAAFTFVLNCSCALFAMAGLFSAEKVYNKKERQSSSFNVHPLVFAIPSYFCQGMWISIYFYWTLTNIKKHWDAVTFMYSRFFFISIVPYSGVWVMIIYCFCGSLMAIKFILRAARHREVDPELTITMNNTLYSRRGYYGDVSLRSGRSDCSGGSVSARSIKNRRVLRSGKYRLPNPGDATHKKSLLTKVRYTDTKKHDLSVRSNRTEKNLEIIQEEEVSNA